MRSFIAAALLTFTCLFATRVLAGPPLVCHPADVAGYETLPWGNDAFETHGTYPIDSVVPDTLAHLAPDTPVIVRMETLRRAAVYLHDDIERRHLLLERLQVRVLDAESAGRPDALAWFDAGFLVQVYHQYTPRSREHWDIGVADGVAGYGWVKKALALRGNDPQMEFAAALMTVMSRQPLSRDHLARAKQGASRDALLARNLERLMPILRSFPSEHRAHEYGG